MLAMSELWLIMGVALTTGVLVALVLDSRHSTLQTDGEAQAEPLSLLFDQGILHHATDRALRTFGFSPGTHDWHDLHDALIRRFPEFPDAVGNCASGSMTLLASDVAEPSRCEINWRKGICWVDVTQSAPPEEPSLPSRRADSPDMICDDLESPIWQLREDGKVGWFNKAFENLAAGCDIQHREHLFPLSATDVSHRCLVERADGRKDWFDVSPVGTGKDLIFHAACVTPLVQAESAQNTFVQTLAKTFAHLSIGLAIFDKESRLSIFNPALVDLTRLQPTFLAGKPTMHSFFDQLRENRGMPEPKNYGTWRQDISDLIAAASGGQYRETWSLEDGRTFSVQGRPHPGGATAFMIEDISTEITLTRNFRVEVEQYEALLDNVADAIVVFSATGVLTFCNAAYRDLWGQNPEASFADVTIHDAVNVWKTRAKDGMDWDAITHFVGALGQRDPTAVDLALTSGARLEARLAPISSDATMVRFARIKDDRQPASPPVAATAR